MSQQNKLAYQTNTLPESHSTNGEFPTSKMLGLEDFYRFFLEWWNLAGENLLETDLSNKKHTNSIMVFDLATHLGCIKGYTTP